LRTPATGLVANHGNFSNGRKYSPSSSRSQRPCLVTCETSASEVALPGITEDLLVFNDDLAGLVEGPIGEPVTHRQVDLGVQPEIGLPLRGMNVDMRPRLALARRS
jgi:hypothetical protein